MRSFAWLAAIALAGCGPSDSNEGGCKDKLVAGDLVITEVFADYAATTGGTGTDEGKEWFEIYNASDRAIDLEGVTIVHGRIVMGTAGPKSHQITAATIAPGQYLTLGNSTRDLLPAYVDYGYSDELGDFFNSDGGKLDLTCGKTVIDSATYESVKSGHSRQLTAAQPPDYTLNDDPASWCEAADTEFETNNFGTPGADNDCAPSVAGMCSDGGGMRPTVAPLAGQIVITEVHPRPAAVGATAGEWFEAKALADFDLNGLGLDRAGDTAKPRILESTDCIHVANGDYVIFAKNEDMTMNGGLPLPIAGTFTFALVDGSPTAPGDVQILYNDTVLDAISWTRSTNGKALQLDPDLTDATSNDNFSNFCDATVTYGAGDFGTPKAANTQCTMLPPAGMCDAGGGNLRAVVKPAANALQITEFLANPANNPDGVSQDATREWFEIKNTSAASFDLNGLTVANPNSTTANTTINSAMCIPVAAGAFGLLARSTDTAVNGMLPAPDATFGFSLVDSGTVDAPAKLEIRDGTTVLETISWRSVSSGLTRQLDPDEITNFATNNDASTTATTQPWCGGATAYGDLTNKGTPKAANAQCP